MHNKITCTIKYQLSRITNSNFKISTFLDQKFALLFLADWCKITANKLTFFCRFSFLSELGNWLWWLWWLAHVRGKESQKRVECSPACIAHCLIPELCILWIFFYRCAIDTKWYKIPGWRSPNLFLKVEANNLIFLWKVQAHLYLHISRKWLFPYFF